MAGRFYEGETKVRPGVYYREENGDEIQLIGARNGIVATAFRANWGPLGKVVSLSDLAEVAKYFGDDEVAGSNVHLLKRILAGGAATILAVRVGSGGSKATVTLKSSESADAVTLTSVYAGSRALSVTIKDSLSVEDMRECIVYSGTAELMKVSFAKGTAEADALVSAVNAVEDGIVTAAKVADAAELAAVTQSAFTGGTSPEVTSADYSTAFELLETQAFNTVCVDSDDNAVHELLHSFIIRAGDAGLLAMAVTADPHSVELETRLAHSRGFDSEFHVHAINGFKVGSTSYDGMDAAAYLAGLIAYLPASDSITNKAIDGATEVVGALTNTQIIECLQSGALLFSVSASGRIRIEQGINTLVTLRDGQDAGWKKIRRTKTRHELITRINENTEKIPGGVNNDSNGHNTIIAIGNGVINDMIAEGKLVSGSISLDSSRAATGDSVWMVIDVYDLDSVEKIYFSYQFHFSA